MDAMRREVGMLKELLFFVEKQKAANVEPRGVLFDEKLTEDMRTFRIALINSLDNLVQDVHEGSTSVEKIHDEQETSLPEQYRILEIRRDNHHSRCLQLEAEMRMVKLRIEEHHEVIQAGSTEQRVQVIEEGNEIQERLGFSLRGTSKNQVTEQRKQMQEVHGFSLQGRRQW